MKKIIFLITVLAFLFPITTNAKDLREKVTLVKCVDGDTAHFSINNETKKTRFLAIDTPESVHPTKKEEPYGKEASTYTCDQLTNAKEIILEYDEKSEKIDKYGRVLAWIFVDGKLLQEDLVSKGYAEVKYLYGNYKYTDKLKEKQKEAKESKLRIWSDEVQNYKTTTEKETTKTTQKTKKTKNEDEIFAEIGEILKKLATKLLKKLENMI